MKYYAYSRPDGVVQFSVVLQDGVEPEPFDGLAIAEIDAQLPPGRHRMRGGRPEREAEVISPDVTKAENKFRQRALLADSDWMVTRAQEEPGKPVPAAWKTYRKALRDLDLADPHWPTPPGPAA